MKRYVPVLAAVLLLAGCTAAPAPSAEQVAPTTPAATTAEAAPQPTATSLSTEEAAAAYLDGVCPANIAGQAYNDAYDAVVAAGSGADIAPLQQASVTLRDANQDAAVAFSSADTVWPAEVDADIDVIASSYFKDLADLDRVIQAGSADEVLAITFSPRSDEEKAAGPRVRTLLGLDLDTQASCAGR
ncbi:hypothetical protein C5B92_06965 [Rathayibacter sp. AY1A4]|uniref:hypothetical protein n=1 Tax=Rathayibacter sp. AY1A4 TaxID=2080522 RepID=UPI000CE80E56|nr:hypothetical protein [Rathayibacter sp. AY1A4]PPF18249.1 hypothetical protein C5B92_06965 [Rathayibacter sp. AY1A4]